MNIEIIREYCLSKKGVTESFPFDNTTLVFKVMDKMFLLASLNEPTHFNAKCDAEYAVELREKYEAVQPGWHMNKNYWNTVDYVSGLPDELILFLIDHSYNLVVAGLTKKVKVALEQM